MIEDHTPRSKTMSLGTGKVSPIGMNDLVSYSHHLYK